MPLACRVAAPELPPAAPQAPSRPYSPRKEVENRDTRRREKLLWRSVLVLCLPDTRDLQHRQPKPNRRIRPDENRRADIRRECGENSKMRAGKIPSQGYPTIRKTQSAVGRRKSPGLHALSRGPVAPSAAASPRLL